MNQSPEAAMLVGQTKEANEKSFVTKLPTNMAGY